MEFKIKNNGIELRINSFNKKITFTLDDPQNSQYTGMDMTPEQIDYLIDGLQMMKKEQEIGLNNEGERE